MQSFQINILNPKAIKLLKDLEDLNLISIQEPNANLSEVLEKLRSKSSQAPSLEEITAEVDKVRSKRHGK